MTQSGYDTSPQWSPDGQWIAFLSERNTTEASDASDTGDDEGKAGKNNDKSKDKAKAKDKDVAQLFLISPNGGEAFPITSGDEERHSFAWSGDSKAIVFATREPWTKQQNDEHKKEWKDTIRYRGDERGDVTSFSRLTKLWRITPRSARKRFRQPKRNRTQRRVPPRSRVPRCASHKSAFHRMAGDWRL